MAVTGQFSVAADMVDPDSYRRLEEARRCGQGNACGRSGNRQCASGNVLLRPNLAARCSQKIGPSPVPGSDTSDHGGGAGLDGSISPSRTQFSLARTAATKANAI